MSKVPAGYKTGEQGAQRRISRLVLINDPEEQRRRFDELSRERAETAARAVEDWLARVRAQRRQQQVATTGLVPPKARRSAALRRG